MITHEQQSMLFVMTKKPSFARIHLSSMTSLAVRHSLIVPKPDGIFFNGGARVPPFLPLFVTSEFFFDKLIISSWKTQFFRTQNNKKAYSCIPNSTQE